MLEQLILILTSPQAIFTAVWSMGLGIVMGALPGLSGPMAMALLLGLTYSLPPELAVMSMILIYMGGVYGGSQSAILLNVPGAAASAATALDGYPLVLKGRAGRTIGMVTVGSSLGTLISVIMLITLTPWLVKVSLLFASWEMALLALLGVLIAGSLAGTADPVKGWISGLLGLMFAMVGQEELHSYPRYAYDFAFLAAGIGLIPVLVGLFGLSEVAATLQGDNPAAERSGSRLSGIVPPLSAIVKHTRVILQSGVIGTIVGIIPGCGADIGGWLSYDAARRTSRHPEEYGHGSEEGVVAVETGNNAVVPGALIPVISLGIPGSAGAAIIMAALFLQGLRPGPLFMIENRALYDNMVVGMILGAFLLLIMGLLLAQVMMHILRVPRENVMAVVLILAVVGAYGSHLRVSDVWVMLFFGLLGYILRRNGFPLAPLVLGVVLGPLLDGNLRRALLVADGSLLPFITRPVSLILVMILVVTIVMSQPRMRSFVARLFLRRRSAA